MGQAFQQARACFRASRLKEKNFRQSLGKSKGDTRETSFLRINRSHRTGYGTMLSDRWGHLSYRANRGSERRKDLFNITRK